MSNKIDWCPFCGGAVSVFRMGDEDEHWFYIAHKKPVWCRVFMESEKFRDGATENEIKAVRSELIAKWNRREYG